MNDWECPVGCKGMPNYGYECPDDLGPDEPCPLGIYADDTSEKEGKKMGFADIWDKSAGVQNRELPNGDYVAKVLECKNGETKSTGMPKIEWVLEIVGGDHAEQKTWIHRVLDQNNPFTIDLAKTDFLNLKVDCSSGAMNKTMKELVGKNILLSLHPSKKGDSQVKDIIGFAPTVAPAPAATDPVMPPVSESPF